MFANLTSQLTGEFCPEWLLCWRCRANPTKKTTLSRLLFFCFLADCDSAFLSGLLERPLCFGRLLCFGADSGTRVALGLRLPMSLGLVRLVIAEALAMKDCARTNKDQARAKILRVRLARLPCTSYNRSPTMTEGRRNDNGWTHDETKLRLRSSSVSCGWKAWACASCRVLWFGIEYRCNLRADCAL